MVTGYRQSDALISDSRFHETNELISDLVVNQKTQSFLFHQPDFVFRHSSNNIVSFPVDHRLSDVVIHFTRQGRSLISLDKSPFGSFIFRRKSSESEVVALIESIIDWAAQHAIDEIIIRTFPECYSPIKSSFIMKILNEMGFETKFTDVNQFIQIDRHHDLPLNIHRRRRWKKCVTSGFTFRRLSAEFLPEAYSLFVESWRKKGYHLSMTLNDLKQMFELFPQNYLLFGVFDGETMIAASVSIIVNGDILYCFYLGDALAYRLYSPVTFLISGIYRYCQQQNFSVLDLGTSGNKGMLSSGVYNFKRSLGSKDSRKFTLCKKIEQ